MPEVSLGPIYLAIAPTIAARLLGAPKALCGEVSWTSAGLSAELCAAPGHTDLDTWLRRPEDDALVMAE